jgi:hypothetical protein
MKNLIAVIVAFMVIAFGFHKLFSLESESMVGGQTFYDAPTQATSTVGIYAATRVLTADTGRQYASFCNPSPTTTNFITLQVTATSSGAYGILVPGTSCHQMSHEMGNLFAGEIWAKASTSTTTLMMVTK